MTNGAKCKLYRAYAFLVYALPMALLFILNHEAYAGKASAFGFWGYIILIFVIAAFKDKFLTLFKNSSLLTISAIFFVIALTMRYLSDEMTLIALVSLIGSLLSTFVDVVGDVYERHSKVIVDGIEQKNRKPAMPDAEAWKEAYSFKAEE